jgi:predicted transcriptional regulator
MAREWPSREEWQAKAEYAVRTSCTMYERLDRAQPDTCWSSLAEDVEMEELARPAAAELRRLLTAEINRLRALLPDRPKNTKPRVAWFVALEGKRYEDACNLSSLEVMRTDIQRAVRNEAWGRVTWHLGRVRKYPAIRLTDDLLAAHDRMEELSAAATERRRAAAQAIEDAAVAREVARRATDEAWEQELERRRQVESPRVIRYG